MEYLEKLLKSKRLPIKNILDSRCTITEKVDGSSLQYYDGKFYKRPNKDSEVDEKKLIDEFVFARHQFYVDAIESLNVTKLSDSEYSDKIINFEILGDDNHFSKRDKDLILISIYDKDGKRLPVDDTEKLGKILKVNTVQTLVKDGHIKDIGIDIDKLCSMHTNEEIWKYILPLFKKKMNVQKDTEGFVFSFDCNGSNRNYKVNNPDFRDYISKNTRNNDNSDNQEYDDVMIRFLKLYGNKRISNKRKRLDKIITIIAKHACDFVQVMSVIRNVKDKCVNVEYLSSLKPNEMKIINEHTELKDLLFLVINAFDTKKKNGFLITTDTQEKINKLI